MALTHEYFSPELAKAVETFKSINPEDKGSQLYVSIKGETVLDLSARVSPESLTSIFSVSKALSAVAIAKLVAAGKLDLDKTVASYWPEFAANGKSVVTVRQMLSHQAGLTETDPHITLEQLHHPHAAAEALAKQKPLWQPGAMFGYHGITIGPLMSELCYRITGKTMQEFYETEIRQLANADAYLGLPEALENRVTELDLKQMKPTAALAEKYKSDPEHHQSGLSAWGFGEVGFDVMVSRAGREFGLPSAEGVASARGLAQVMHWALGFGGKQPGISPAAIDDMSQVQVYGYDVNLEQDHRSHGTIFQKSTPTLPIGSYRAIGHDGAAGALLYADPIGEIVFAYTCARFTFPGGYDREIIPIMEMVRWIANAK